MASIASLADRIFGAASSNAVPLQAHPTAKSFLDRSSGLSDPLQQSGRLLRSSTSDSFSAVPPYGDTLSAATNLGTLSGTQNISGAINFNGDNDYFRFSLSTITNLSASLFGLAQDADLEIIRDGDLNGVVDAGEVLKSSRWGGTTAESISLQGLGAGTYYARVYPWGGAITNYSLSLTATAGLGFATESNNTLGTAYDIGGPGYPYSDGNLNGTRTFSGWVGDTDTQDVYRLNLGATSNLSLSLRGLSADADIDVIRDSNFNGIIDAGEVLRSGTYGGSSSESINLAGLGVGNYYVQVRRFGSANTSYTLSMSTPSSFFNSFSTYDASGDTSYNTVFQGGALRFNYSLGEGVFANSIGLQAINSATGAITNLGSWSGSSVSNALINLGSFPGLSAGNYSLRAVAYATGGDAVYSSTNSLSVLSWGSSAGSFTADTFNYAAGAGSGSVFLGRGGTDTLNLGIDRSQVASINGLSLSSYNPLTNSTWYQATFRGTAFDFVTLADGREIYFQGIENLRFSDGSRFELQARPNDTHYGSQWNLHVSDVDSAWRFTRGASNVLLASLDTGVLSVLGGSDMAIGRLITNAATDDIADSDHGHNAVSVMSSTANNGVGVAGINWNSNTYVQDVYFGTRVNLQQAIQQVISYARARNMRVVFQGGIQGESWLNDGGTQAQLETLISNNSDIAVFAVAAGNGGPGGNLNDPNYLNSVSGVAKLQTTRNNVIAVGALRPGSATNFWYSSGSGVTTVNGLTNATSVSLASYSNRGSNLTLVAATDSPAMNNNGSRTYFGGTSAANPNMAGIASLVWSVNSSLNGGQVRQILIDTAMDLGASGRDNTFGHGLVNADAAVRRAAALSRNSDVANLYSGSSILA